MAEKLHCDICDKILVKERVDFGLYHKRWELREYTYIFDIRLIPSPCFKNWRIDKVMICKECIADFKEFIERKKAYKSDNAQG